MQNIVNIFACKGKAGNQQRDCLWNVTECLERENNLKMLQTYIQIYICIQKHETYIQYQKCTWKTSQSILETNALPLYSLPSLLVLLSGSKSMKINEWRSLYWLWYKFIKNIYICTYQVLCAVLLKWESTLLIILITWNNSCWINFAYKHYSDAWEIIL